VEVLDLLAGGDPPAFATDARERVVFWNRGAERLLGCTPQQALGRQCHQIVDGRDPYGNRYCHENCSVVAMGRRGEPVRAFELRLPRLPDRALEVNVLCIPGTRPELFTMVHVLATRTQRPRLERTVARLRGRVKALADAVPLAAAAQVDEQVPVSARERQILGWVACGLHNKEIARRLEISPATVRNHVHNILAKLGVHSKLEAIVLAFRRGWLVLGRD
jgi:DNA-binding CsgD family transcriptional regulator